MSKEQIIKRLNEITSNFNFIYVLAAIVLRDFCGTLNKLASKNVQEHFNNNEVRFLMGLWIRNWNPNKAYDYDDEIKIFEEVYELMEQLHYTFIPDISKMIENPSKSPFDFFNNGLFF